MDIISILILLGVGYFIGKKCCLKEMAKSLFGKVKSLLGWEK
jgi:hypothetical protein